MFPPFPEEEAGKILKTIYEKLANGGLFIEQVTKESAERKNHGIMLGALVCKDENNCTVNLVTNSGIAKKIVTDDESLVVVPPVVSAVEIESALSENDRTIHELTDKIKSLQDNPEKLPELNAQLKRLCSESLEKVHALYNFHCADGKTRTLKEVCLQYNNGKLPPTGIGDCCAPKLLNYAFRNNLQPVSMAESYFECVSDGSPAVLERSGRMSVAKGGRSDWREATGTPELIPPCDNRCGILLPAMLGLRILYRDEHIIVVNKQSGVLSVPGRIEKDCIVNRVRRLFPDCIEQPSVHRLDMETSGLLVLAFTKDAHRNLNKQFEEAKVKKEYIALLDGVLAKKGIPQTGQMELFFRLDVDNRPHQIWDAENGKKAITEWQILNVEKYQSPDGTIRNATRVLFKPHTGRTHQLRLASSDSHGFGVPIIGDTLYGTCDKGERLMLHARYIAFQHPATGEMMEFTCESEF